MKIKKCKCGGDALLLFEKVSVKKYGVDKLYFVECLKCKSKSVEALNQQSAIERWSN